MDFSPSTEPDGPVSPAHIWVVSNQDASDVTEHILMGKLGCEEERLHCEEDSKLRRGIGLMTPLFH
jgi:hypothetical protein